MPIKQISRVLRFIWTARSILLRHEMKSSFQNVIGFRGWHLYGKTLWTIFKRGGKHWRKGLDYKSIFHGSTWEIWQVGNNEIIGGMHKTQANVICVHESVTLWFIKKYIEQCKKFSSKNICSWSWSVLWVGDNTRFKIRLDRLISLSTNSPTFLPSRGKNLLLRK